MGAAEGGPVVSFLQAFPSLLDLTRLDCILPGQLCWRNQAARLVRAVVSVKQQRDHRFPNVGDRTGLSEICLELNRPPVTACD